MKNKSTFNPVSKWNSLTSTQKIKWYFPVALLISIIPVAVVAPGALNKYKAIQDDMRAIRNSPPIESRVDPQLEIEKKRLFDRKEEEKAKIHWPLNEVGPIYVEKVARKMGGVLASLSVDQIKGYPAANPVNGFDHWVQAKLVGDWSEIKSGISNMEEIIEQPIRRIAFDKTPDGRIAVEVTWVVTSISKEWGKNK